jgi:hypothetical protein
MASIPVVAWNLALR